MPSLGSLFYTLNIRDLTDADLQRINAKLKNLGFDITLTPKILKDLTQSAVPKGVKIELDPTIKNEALARAVEGKVMRVAVLPLLTGFREAIVKATRENPPQAEVGVSEARLRTIIQNVLNKQGFMLNISTVNDNYSKAIQAKLNGTRYNVKIHADANEITRSVQASLMQVQSRYFGLKVSRDILYRSIDEALGQKRFNINIAVQHDQARKAVQDALLRAQVIGKDQALAYQRLQTGEMKAAQAELMRLKAAHQEAANAAKAHATASVNLGGAMGSNIKIAGELGSAMTSLYSIHAAKQFLSQVIEIGGELEHQKIAMDTIFGDKGKTSELFGQIKGLARQSPFGVMELTKSVKALSAYGVQYNEIYDTAKRLADISAATSVDINRLILAFGKTKSRGFLDGLEAKQFAYANIPIYEMVRKKLEELEGQAVTTADVMARMKKREIGFDIVKDVLWDLTDEGGKFYNMQEALAGSVKTSWKLVRDNIDLMFGEIAESSVGGALKSIAEVLQTMTRNWRTMGAAVASVVTVLGLSKIATYGLNRAMEQSVGASTRQILADKKKEAAKLRAIRLTSSLTAEEERLIRTSNRLTAEDIKQAYAKEGIAKETVRMLYLTKQLSAEEVKRLATMGMIDAQTAKSIVGTNRLAGAYARLKVSLGGIRQSIGMAMGAMFNWTTAIFAAIGALAMLWQRNSEFNRQAKETSEDIYSKAAEGANNLKKTFEDIKPSAGLSEHELTQGIAQMQQAIKDYSPTPIEDINNALVDQKGHVRGLTEQYDILQKRVATLADAFDGVANKKVSDALESAIKSTKKNFLSDDIEKQYQDLGSAMEDAKSNILAFEKANKTSLHGIIEEAANLSPAYRKAIANMTHDEQKFQELAMNSGKYWNEMSADIQASMKEALNGDFWREGLQSIERLNRWNAAGRWNRASDAAKEAARDLVEGFKTELRNQGADISQYTEDQLRTIFTSYINGRQLSEDMKKQMKIDVGAELKISLIEEDPIGDAIKDQLKRLAGDEDEIKSLSKELGMENAGEILKGALLTIQYDGYDALSPAGKQVVDKLMGDAKMKAMDELGKTNEEMAAYLSLHPLTQLINIVYQERNKPSEFQKELWDNNPNLHKYLLMPREYSWYNSWTGGSSGYYETKNKIKQDLESRYNEILAAKNASEEWRKAKQKEFDAMKALAADMGYDDIEVGAKGPNKHPKGSDTDDFAKDLKQRFKDIKDAWSEFQKWSKTEGRKAAATRIGESGLFSTLSKDKIPQTVEQYRALVVELENELRKAGVKGTARESLLNDLLKQLLDIDKTVVDEQLKLALDKVSKEAERQLADWNLFDKIRKATGNEKLAMSIGFGLNADAETDYPKLIEQQLDKQTKAYETALAKKNKGYTAQGYTYASLKELYDKANAEGATDADMNAWLAVPDKIREAWEKANGDILKYFDQQREAVANILSEYQTLQDKINGINAKRDRDIAAVNQQHRDEKTGEMVYDIPDGDERKRLEGLINAKADWEIFQKSSDYMSFFNDIYGLTLQKAQQIGDAIQMHLNDQLQRGLITIYEYEQQMEKVRKQLDAMRNIKSDAMTFLTGGVKGLNDKRLAKAQGELTQNPQYKAMLEKQFKLQQEIEEARKNGDEESLKNKQKDLDKLNEELKVFTKIRDAIVKNQEQWQDVLDVANIAANIAGGISDAFNSIRDMADALGFDTESNAWLNVGGVIDTLTSVTGGISKAVQSAMKGDIGGIISGTFDTLLSPITIWSKLHDKKLQKQIEESQRVYDLLDKQLALIADRLNFALGSSKQITDPQAERDKARYDEAVRRSQRNDSVPGMPSFYGPMYKLIADKLRPRVEAYETGGVYAYQRQLMAEQVASLTNQRNAEADKKDSDSNAIADYNNQIASLQQQIRDFAESTIETLYGINIRSWAEDIGSALIDAFARGEDAAEAFDKAVGDIMRDVVKQMAIKNILEKQFEDMRTYLFGADGMSGAFGADFDLDKDDVAGLKAYFDKIKETVPQIQELFDGVNEATGGLLDEDSSKSGLSAGIQGVTEDTADLLASYLNATRADVSEQTHVLWPRLLDDVLPQMNVIAESQLKMQQQIAANTLRNAIAAEAIVKSNDEINKLLARVTQGGAKFYIH